MEESTRTTLPLYATSLIGRTVECAALRRLLQTSSGRIVTLVGESGTGKTRLALEVATALASSFPDGIIFVPLAPIQDAQFVITAIAEALGIQEDRQQSLLQTLIVTLHNAAILLILDNIEQVRACVPELTMLLQGTQRLKLLVTSQVALEMPEEVVYAIPPLSTPTDDIKATPDRLLQYPAIALFVNRLQAIQPGFQMTVSNALAVRRICQLLDGFPLAIELVAAHSAALSPQNILLLLRTHLGPLAHQSRIQRYSRTDILRPVLDWCVSRLPACARQLMETMGVFLGGWKLEDCHAVLAPDQDRAVIKQALDLLIEKHLVLQETLPNCDRRYMVLDAIRDYSQGRLMASFQRDTLQERHCRYYLQFAETAVGAAHKGHQQGTWLRQLRCEHHNVRAALSWSLGAHQDLFVQLVTSLGWFWRVDRHLGEGRHWLKHALGLTHVSIDFQATLFSLAGSLEMAQDGSAQALTFFQRSLLIHQSTGNQTGVAQTLLTMGAAAFLGADFPAALEYYGQSALLWHELQNPLRRAYAVFNIGETNLILNNLDAAAAALEEAYIYATKAGDQILLGVATANRGWVAYERQVCADGLAFFREALRSYQNLDLVTHMPEVLEGIAGIYSLLGHAEVASCLLGGSTTLRRMVQTPLLKVYQTRNGAIMERIQRQLPEDVLAGAFAHGTMMELAGILQLATHPEATLLINGQ